MVHKNESNAPGVKDRSDDKTPLDFTAFRPTKDFLFMVFSFCSR